MGQGSALTASGRATRAAAANRVQEQLGLTNNLQTALHAGTAALAGNRSNAFDHEPANV